MPLTGAADEELQAPSGVAQVVGAPLREGELLGEEQQGGGRAEGGSAGCGEPSLAGQFLRPG